MNLQKLSITLVATLCVSMLMFIVMKKNVSANRGPIIDEIMFELEDVKPGDKITRSYTVTHDYAPLADGSDPVVSFDVEVVDFTQNSEDGKPIFSTDTATEVPEQLRLSSWVTVEPSTFVLSEQGQSQTLVVEINVPKDAQGGGRYGSILLKPQFIDGVDENGAPLQSRPSAQAGVNTELHTLLFVTVAGDINVDMDVVDFHVETLSGEQKSIFWNPPIKAVVTFRNKGNVHLAPRGIIFFHNGKDEIAARLNAEYTEQLNDELTYILPGATRTYEYTWQPNSFIYQEPIELHGDENMTLKPGDAKYDEAPVYKTIYSTKFDWSNLSKIKFGKYSASIQYSADNDSDFADLEARTEIVSFYFVPIQIIVPAVVLLVLFALVIFFIGWRSKRSKTKMTSSMSPAENNMQMQAPAQSAAMQPQANATNM